MQQGASKCNRVQERCQLPVKVGEYDPGQGTICHPNLEGFIMNEHDGPRVVELAVLTDLVKLQALRDTPACQ